MNDMERDLLLLCKNAKTFNEPGSLIHKDAMVLAYPSWGQPMKMWHLQAMRKFIQKRKVEMMETGAVPVEKGRAEANAELIDVPTLFSFPLAFHSEASHMAGAAAARAGARSRVFGGFGRGGRDGELQGPPVDRLLDGGPSNRLPMPHLRRVWAGQVRNYVEPGSEACLADPFVQLPDRKYTDFFFFRIRSRFGWGGI